MSTTPGAKLRWQTGQRIEPMAKLTFADRLVSSLCIAAQIEMSTTSKPCSRSCRMSECTGIENRLSLTADRMTRFARRADNGTMYRPIVNIQDLSTTRRTRYPPGLNLTWIPASCDG